MPLRIGNAQGFWGDTPHAAHNLVAQEPLLDYLTLDYLAEVSLSILAIQREKDPTGGYARDFVKVIQSLIPHWKAGSHVKIITNAGGLAPERCAEACAEVLREAGIRGKKIGIVSGDDVLAYVRETEELGPQYVTANAYMGALPIVEALTQGAEIIITGRTADPSLTVAPCVHHYGWGWTDYDALAGATIAGHLIECGTQVTGGISTHWLEISNHTNWGFPIAEVSKEGTCVLTKPPQTGGCVTIETVKEQLLYEIDDPENYLSPDVTVSFTSLQMEQIDTDRVRIRGAKGKPPPTTLKVSVTYRDGYKAEGMLAIVGPDAVAKGDKCAELLFDRVRAAGYTLERTDVSCLGNGDVVPGVLPQPLDLPECILRVCVADSRKEAVACFANEIAPLVTCGPQGVTGYTSGRPKVRPVFAFYPCLIPRETVHPHVEVIVS